jgi:hypothetical protein
MGMQISFYKVDNGRLCGWGGEMREPICSEWPWNAPHGNPHPLEGMNCTKGSNDVVAGFSTRSTRWKQTRAKARDYIPLAPRFARLNHQIFTRSSGFMNSLSPFFTLNAAYQLSILRSGIEPRAAPGE